MASLDLTEDSSSENLAGESDIQLDQNFVSADHVPSTDVGERPLDDSEEAIKQEWNTEAEKSLFSIGEGNVSM